MMSNSTNNTEGCERINNYDKNSTFVAGYEGIPHNLVVNLITSVALLLVFLMVRKIAWRYSQAALLSSETEDSWSQLFNVNYRRVASENVHVIHEQARQRKNTKLRAGLKEFIKLKDKDIVKVAGGDAGRYMKLQRYLFIYLLIIAVPALAIVLPLNIRGGYTDYIGEFSSSTINNLSGESQFLWAHAILAGVYMIIAVVLMLFYSRRVAVTAVDSLNTCCLMISNLPEAALDPDSVKRHIASAYPTASVKNVNLTYDVCKLQQLHDESKQVAAILQVCRESLDNPVVTNCKCSWLCNGCCCGTQDAVEYYSNRLQKLNDKLASESDQSKRKKLPIVFVEFSDADGANMVLHDFQRARSLRGLITRRHPASGDTNDLMQPNRWSVRMAPYPEDVNWYNLQYCNSLTWYLRAVIVNVVLFFVLFFFTTPIYIVNLLKAHNPAAVMDMPIISNFLPTLFMWLFAILLPFLVYYSDVLVKHWTKSSENYNIMFKCSIFQLLMIMILPSLGLSRADTLIKWLFSMKSKDNQNFRQRWECVFVSDNASFFVNYVITTAFIGCCAELLRISEMIWYAVKWMGAKSKAEATLMFQQLACPYDYGFNFSWMVCIFGIIVTYVNVAPLIVVFGVFYMAMKIVVDRYNLYYAYKPSVMDRSCHRLAQSLVLFCVLLGQLFVTGFFLFRIPEYSDPRTIFMWVMIAGSITYLTAKAAVHLFCEQHCYEPVTGEGPDVAENQAHKSEYKPEVLLRPSGNEGNNDGEGERNAGGASDSSGNGNGNGNGNEKTDSASAGSGSDN